MADSNQTSDIKVNDLGFTSMRSSVLPSADHVLVSTGFEGKMEWRPYSSGSFTSWIDISATSTIVGWSAFSSRRIRYNQVGKIVFVEFTIQGTSDSISATFTLPISSGVASTNVNVCFGLDNSIVAPTLVVLPNSSNVVQFVYNLQSPFTNSGDKQVTGQFFYEID